MAGSITDWRTPQALFDLFDSQINFAVDAAADESNHLCDTWYGPGSASPDALSVPVWLSPAWCNPPYDRNITKWLKKFREQQEIGVTTVALLPAKTDTNWWHTYVVPFADIWFLKGRVPFEPPDELIQTDAPLFGPKFASAIVIYRDQLPKVKWFDWKLAIENATSDAE